MRNLSFKRPSAISFNFQEIFFLSYQKKKNQEINYFFGGRQGNIEFLKTPIV